ncbi:MAG TPA: hypothetical protein VKM72_22185 [Thermoanaerobaculia bacterium]|nr:hypothetical protein [Thermoanaerobaculia bacterium]
MKKEPSQPNQKTDPLALRKETLRSLGDSELRGVDGAARMWKPVGFDDDTTPIYAYEEVP